MPDPTLESTLLAKASSIGPAPPRVLSNMPGASDPTFENQVPSPFGMAARLIGDPIAAMSPWKGGMLGKTASAFTPEGAKDSERLYEVMGGMYEPDKAPEALLDLMKTKAARIAVDASKDLFHKFTGDAVPNTPGDIVNWLYRKMPVSPDAPRIVDNAKPPMVR